MDVRLTSSKTPAAKQLCWEAGGGPPADGGAHAPMCLPLAPCYQHQSMTHARVPALLEHLAWVLERKQKPDESCLLVGGSRVRLYLELWHGRMPQPWRGYKNSGHAPAINISSSKWLLLYMCFLGWPF